MVFIDIYEPIWKFLEKEGLIDEAIDLAEDVCGGKVISKYNGTELLADIVLENALFNLVCKKELLIDYVEKKLFDSLNEEDKKEFILLKASKRESLTFVRKEKLDRKDTYGKDFYRFYFKTKKGEQRVILSATHLEKQGKKLNMRLIRLPEEKAYAVIGVILNVEALEMMRI
jgi:hypothetical protein